ncbi:MAG TPA: FtsX-like permease family protein [Steroidobacteraceae bacterium]|nr:FtsX-like permease family protein [Steroidobacteraceae bacterium]
MANTLAQVQAVTAMNLRNIPARWTSALVAVIGVAGVSLVLIAVLSIAEGFRAALEFSGSEDVAIVLRAGSTDELTSGILQTSIPVISDAPGVRRTDNARPMVSAELFVIVDAKLRNKDASANAPLRGITPLAPQLRKNFELLEGRLAREGTNEVIIGNGVAQQYEGLAVGKTVRWGSNDWQIVGRFADGGGIAESEVWADARVVQQAFNRGSTYQSARVKLASVASFQQFKDALGKDPRVNVRIVREPVFYAEQQELMQKLVSSVGWTLALMMGLGAILAALNTMYNAVASRVREIATLRAMGFGAAPVVASVLIEALILGALGGLLGGALAYLLLNGMRSSTLNFQNFSQITYAFTVTPKLMLTGIVYGLILTLLAGVMPGIRAARTPITTGLREL